MHYVRTATLFFLALVFFVIQSCGSAKTDTNGSLTLTDPVIKDNTDGTYSVSTTATYSTPAGKVPNGVVIHFVETENGVELYSFDDTLTSSPTITHTFSVFQSTVSSIRVRIVASIGDMSSSVSAVVPVLAAVNATPIQYLQTEAAGTVKTTTITGGIAPYALMTASTADLAVSLSGSVFSVSTKNVPGNTVKTGSFIIQDSLGNSGQVQVNYF